MSNPLTLADLVVLLPPHGDAHASVRTPTREDWIEVGKSLGGVVADIGYTPGDADGEFVEFQPGRYLVIPIEEAE